MNLNQLPFNDFKSFIKKKGVTLDISPFHVNISTSCERVIQQIYSLYSQYEVIAPDNLSDFSISVKHQRTFFRPQAQFYFDDFAPFLPLPATQDFPIFEWGLNWCIANHCHQFLSLHAAVLSRDSQAIILPGFPGAGKSTLTAYLMFKGWTLFSDELCLVDKNSHIISCVRPVSLKNTSIEVIKQSQPLAQFSPAVSDTAKGTISHLKPLDTHVKSNTARAKWIVFPKYSEGSKFEIIPINRSRAFVHLAEQGFNYHILGKEGFFRLKQMLAQAECFQIEYSNLDDVSNWLEILLGRT